MRRSADRGYPSSWSADDNGSSVVRINAGEYSVVSDGEVIVTVLGSCVSVCMADSVSGVSGMNHFMLPGSSGVENASDAARWGAHSMELLVRQLLTEGATRKNLWAKIVGGSELWEASHTIGTRNIECARHYLKKERIKILGEHVGGERARRVHFRTREGVVWVKLLPKVEVRALQDLETSYRTSLQRLLLEGDGDMV